MILIDDKEIEGKFTVTGIVDRSKNPPILTVEGYIETSVRIPDRIKEMYGGRVAVQDILVNSESIGSEENTIVYGFTARGYKIFKIS